MLSTLASHLGVAFATLVLAVALTTVPALLALGTALWAVAGVVTGTALREPRPVPVPPAPSLTHG